jgi:hypothetical protein
MRSTLACEFAGLVYKLIFSSAAGRKAFFFDLQEMVSIDAKL